MTDFERALVNAFNRHFDDTGIKGIAYRRKQHRFSSQFVDVLVDSMQPQFYLAIENKSIKTESSNKLYFSQHFSESQDGHQVDRISEFLNLSGRNGYLAVELRNGRGTPREAYLLPWHAIRQPYEDGEPGVPLEAIRDHPTITRDGEQYDVASVVEAI